MKATHRCWAIAGMVMMLSFCHTSVRANGQTPSYRWGVGWDDGVALRYMTSPEWGLGLTLNPSVRGGSNDQTRELDGETSMSRTESGSDDIRVGLMVFRQAELGRGVALGPFARLMYTHGSSESTDTFTDSGRAAQSRTFSNDAVAVQLGIRPTFTFRDRFVLETRVGVSLSHLTSERTATGDRNGPDYKMHDKSDNWRFDILGQDLGPGAVMTFIVLF